MLKVAILLLKKHHDDSTIETIDVTGAKVSGSGGTANNN